MNTTTNTTTNTDNKTATQKNSKTKIYMYKRKSKTSQLRIPVIPVSYRQRADFEQPGYPVRRGAPEQDKTRQDVIVLKLGLTKRSDDAQTSRRGKTRQPQDKVKDSTNSNSLL